MTTPPSDQAPAPVDESQETYCYGHPNRPTKLRCSRCDRYICGSCAIPASVGQHCPECVAEARKSAPKVRTAMAVNAPVTRAIIGVTIVVYVLELFLGDAFVDRFTSFGPAIYAGEVYRLLTSVFLHLPFDGRLFSLLHIVFNMYILSIYGAQVEQLFGRARFLFLYLATGFFASATSYAFNDCPNGLGASGAVFGVVGILIVYLYNRRSTTFTDQYLRSMLTFVVLNLALGFMVPRIDNLAHIGGLVAGLGLGAGFDRGRLTKPASPAALQLAASLVVVGAAIALVVQRAPVFDCF